MIKSGLVQFNKGYGTYPSDHTNDHSIFIRPSIPLEPSNEDFLPTKKQPNTVSKGRRLRTNDILFPRYNLSDLFGPTYPRYNNEGVQEDGKPLPSGSATPLGRENGAGDQPGDQPETILLTPLAEGAAGLQAHARHVFGRRILSIIDRTLRGVGRASRYVYIEPMYELIVNLLTDRYHTNMLAIEAVLHALMPQPVAVVMTQGLRAVTDNMEMLRRVFRDAITNPTARMTGDVVFASVNRVLFEEGGVLGPGYVQTLANAIISVPAIDWENFGRIALQGAAAGRGTIGIADTVLHVGGGAAVMTISNLVTVYLYVFIALVTGIIAPAQGIQMAQIIRGQIGNLRNVPRINYAGMGG